MSTPCKVKYQNEIRRFNFSGSSLEELEKALKNIFNYPPEEPVVICYQDEENDIVNIGSNQELSYALDLFLQKKLGPLLRLQISRKTAEDGPKLYTPPFARSSSTPQGLALPNEIPNAYQQIALLKEHVRVLKHKSKFENREMRRRGQRPQGERMDVEKLNARFVKHVTVPDGMEYAPGVCFQKTWRLLNSGNLQWPQGTIFARVSKSNELNAPDYVEAPSVNVGEEADITVQMTAPTSPGLYTGFWRLIAPSQKKFGQRVRVQIQVASPYSDSSGDDGSSFDPVDDGRFDQQLAQLNEMGILAPRPLALRLLQKHSGDMTVVTKKLIRRQTKLLGVSGIQKL